ncbi:alpha-galactosidase/6-phospho-beta-glucosidase family protein [Evansella vedderi]|uniref:Alpha-galactosidase/6-phospho-beta-glucosidase family protein n=1 Tax=Evansella vedderi TaxID=38282 RepID=A0ABT9ZW04_9BACI|nr:DUF4355 domain-containing protein [Evansella vedderi]MDQ0254921.1 alpha-galactosidase/6-phospho-beta-glucosidase family protein [Evansella vedderi]
MTIIQKELEVKRAVEQTKAWKPFIRLNIQHFADGDKDDDKGDKGDKGDGEKGGDKGDGDKTPQFSKEQEDYLQKMIQSATDKVRTTYSKENKELKDKIDAYEKEKMTDEERKEHEKQQYEKSLKDKEVALNEKEQLMLTSDLLDEKKLPQKFKNILAGGDEKQTKENVETFAKLWQEEVERVVNERFKKGGMDDPASGGGPSKTPKTLSGAIGDFYKKK